MSTTRQAEVRIETCAPSHWGAALWLATGGASAKMAPGRVAALLAAKKNGKIDFEGLLVARRDDRLVAALWLQRQPGRMATLWGPAKIASEPVETVTQLLALSLEWAEAQGCRIIQSIWEDRPPPVESSLYQAGFRQMAQLAYLNASDDQFPQDPPVGSIIWQPYRPELQATLESLVEATYQGSLDCPEIDGLRGIDEVLSGYREAGDLGEAGWFLATRQGYPIGCLLLAYHQAICQAELVYCGLIPEARGLGLGKELTQFALGWAGRQNAERLVLAVDCQNQPAIRSYRRCGLVEVDRKRLWIRSLR